MENEEVSTEVAESTEEVAVQPEQETEVKEETTEAVEPGIAIPPPKKQTAQERINEVTRLRREAEREAEYWRKIALEKEAKPEIPKVEPTDGRPTIDNFQTAEEYEDALIAWHESKRSEKIQKERQQEEEAQLVSQFKEKAAKVREVYEDFDEVVNQPVFSPHMRDALLRSENGAEVSYFLARPENAAIREKIKSYPPSIQVYELGKLEAKMELAKKTKTVTKATAPIDPIDTTGGGGVVDESKLSDDEWFKRRQQLKREEVKKKYGG